jgi:hypothetical protein
MPAVTVTITVPEPELPEGFEVVGFRVDNWHDWNEFEELTDAVTAWIDSGRESSTLRAIAMRGSNHLKCYWNGKKWGAWK